jgi:predicted nuclease of predicted toxin-antitoxin system
MKLLVDQNISHRIIQPVSHLFTSLFHVRDLALTNADDHEIFMFAKENGFDAVVTIDDDFVKLLNLFSSPPKIIWIRTGNCSTSALSEILAGKYDAIKVFIESGEYILYEVFKP